MNRENILNESRGVVSGLHEVVKAICERFIEQVKKTIEEKREISKNYAFDVKHMGFDTFFDTANISLTTNYTPYITDIKYKGGLVPSKSYQKPAEKLICTPDIFYKITASSEQQMMDHIESALGHELTHAFNLYQYGVKNNLEPFQIMSNYLYTQNYKAIATARDDTVNFGNRRAIGSLLYQMNRMERGAYIAQLKQEIEKRADEITDSKSAWEAVLESDSYTHYRNIEKNIELILNDCTGFVLTEILKLTNQIMGTNLKNNNELKKWYERQWYKWKTKYITTAAKIAYDVYAEHNQFLDGDMGAGEIIKPF